MPFNDATASNSEISAAIRMFSGHVATDAESQDRFSTDQKLPSLWMTIHDNRRSWDLLALRPSTVAPFVAKRLGLPRMKKKQIWRFNSMR